MNKKNKTTGKVYGIVCMLFLFGCLVFCSGCGVTEYYTLDAPISRSNYPSWDTTEYLSKYFEFMTNESGMSDYLGSSSEFVFLGTAVYYKIYNNHSTLDSRTTAISSVNTSSNYSTAATKMIETYGYQQLGTNAGTITPLIAATGSNRKVYIRLMHNGSSDDYSAKITVAGTKLAVPLRVGNEHTFDFGRTADNSELNRVPKNGDDDVEYGTASSGKKWYVDMYAVAIGRDTSYSNTYSLVLHLGSVTIDADEYNN